jgi:predicted molibdopterin-dependent oxidoreductase YjgC
MTKEKRLSITIDNKTVEVRPNITILQAARENGVYIPSLCILEHLPSYGACRLCVVEVDGLRGFPTSCTTPVEDGMVIRTDTAEVRSLRQEVLKLLLSEHPASCLFCTEQSECKDYQGTIRKVGVTTGCRYCPNDTRCELQLITEKVGLTETSYPVYYRNFPVEKEDPFYDRDYNLCILCGRCVRVCNDVRLNGTLSFKQRGKQTTIGPAFDRTHLEAGCEFCGACVTVCPTGALSTKVSKWYGKPDSQVGTTCVYCPVGCKVILQVKNDETIDALPDYDSPLDRGLICVKGRFAIPEYVHSAKRYISPQRATPVGYEDISWDQAIDEAKERLSGIRPEDCFIMVSPQLSNEDLFVAQRFARDVMKSEEIFSLPIADLGADLMPFLDLVMHASPYDVIDTAQAVLTIGFDSTYGFTPIGIQVKAAARRGANLVTIGSLESNLDMLAETVHQAEPSRWAGMIDALGKAMSGNGAANVVVVGPDIVFDPARRAVFDKVIALRDAHKWKVIVAHPYTNLLGMLATGAFTGIKPGEALKNGGKGGAVTIKGAAVYPDLKGKRKVVYVIGEAQTDMVPPCDYLIYQNGLPPEGDRKPDLILPACMFTEASGTTVNAEGKVLAMQKACEPFMKSKPDWWIMSRVAEKLRKGTIKYNSVQAIQGDIKKRIKGFFSMKKGLEFVKVNMKEGGEGGRGAASSHAKRSGRYREEAYRGTPLASVVSGMKAIEERRRHE